MNSSTPSLEQQQQHHQQQQQHQQPTESQDALAEANAVLEVVGENYLDGFNLLGVIANPLSGTSYLSSATTASATTTSATSATTTPTTAISSASNAVSPNDTSSSAYDAYATLESTLTSVTEQMESWNHWLDDFSRQILDEEKKLTSAAAGEEQQLPETQLRQLPPYLLNLPPLEHYVATQPASEGGEPAAARFRRRVPFDPSPEQPQQPQQYQSEHSNHGESTTAHSPQEELDIPEIFFRESMDLTDPQTFRQLVLQDKESSNNNSSNVTNETDTEATTSLPDDRPVHEWFPLQPADAFGTSLDQVELALLQQVRSKSGDFFAESLRFAQLQQGMDQVVQQVVHLQSNVSHLQHDWVDPMQAVPLLDQQRVDLRHLLTVLDETDELLQCKTSLAGVLSAQDDLTAVAQIQYGRQLLASTRLQKVQALHGVAQQLNQYEQLVVTNLREELVEVFLGWNTNINNSNNNNATVYSTRQEKEERVRDIVRALTECKALDATREAYSNRLQDVIRMTVRTTVGEFAAEDGGSSVLSRSATAMSLERFLDCLDMLFEQLLALLQSANGVDQFCANAGYFVVEQDQQQQQEEEEEGAEPSRPMGTVMIAAADLSSKSVSELLRLRKEAHSLVTLQQMKTIWDACLSFITTVEEMSGHSSTLRSTLLAQAKAFVERKHESNMSALVAALDSEIWKQCDVSAERQEALTRLCSGRSLAVSTPTNNSATVPAKSPEAELEGTRYKVVWSCLLLLEMVTTNIAAAAHFSSLTSGIVGKIAELLRLFNSRTTQLVLGAGAIHSNAKLKSINAKHLSLVTQCLGMVIATIPHIHAALMVQLPKKQHTLLNDLYQIRKEYADHNEKVLNKFVTIIGGIVEHGLAPKIAGTDFDARANATGSCIFLGGVATNTKKMHQVLKSLLPPEHLRDVFSRIFSFVDTKVPELLISAADNGDVKFTLPRTDLGKKQLLLETQNMITSLNGLEGVLPWDFTAVAVLERKIEYKLETDKKEQVDAAGECKQDGDQTEESGESKQNGEESNDENEVTLQDPPPVPENVTNGVSPEKPSNDSPLSSTIEDTPPEERNEGEEETIESPQSS